MKSLAGTQGYEAAADLLLRRWESLTFEAVHSPVLHWVPSRPAHALDVGSGDGRDAAYLAQRGWHVTAAEPVDALREGAMRRHESPLIEWIDDGFPDLAAVRGLERSFDLVLVTAVWQHLDRAQRSNSMANLAALMSPRGRLIMSIRRGPAPASRRQFAVPADETIASAEDHDLTLLLSLEHESIQQANRDAEVTWLRLVFEKSANNVSPDS